MLRRCVTTSSRSTAVRPTSSLPLPVCSSSSNHHHHHLLASSSSAVSSSSLVQLWSRSITARPSGRPMQQAAREAHAESLANLAAAQLAARESKSADILTSMVERERGSAATKANIVALLASLVMNNKIAAKEVRLVHENIKKVVPIELALELAQKHGLDLIQVVEGPPPVCRLLDARAYLYEKIKKEKEREKIVKVSSSEQRMIRIGVKCDTNDLITKSRKIRQWLDAGDSVRIQFRGWGDDDMRETASRLAGMLEDCAVTNDDITKLCKDAANLTFMASHKSKAAKKKAATAAAAIAAAPF